MCSKASCEVLVTSWWSKPSSSRRRRQAPVRMHQKFYFPSGIAEGDCRIDVLKKMASTTMKLQELRNSPSSTVVLTTSDGPMNIDMLVSKVGGDTEAKPEVEPEEQPVK